jgi:serine protease
MSCCTRAIFFVVLSLFLLPARLGTPLGVNPFQYMAPFKVHRVVVTFHTWDLAKQSYNVSNATLVKKYGRRQVWDLEKEVNMSVDVPRITQEIGQDRVAFIEADEIAVIDSADTLYDRASDFAWYLQDNTSFSLQVEKIWNYTNSTPNIVVAVVDTGISEAGKSMLRNLLPGYDFVSNIPNSMDGDGRDSDPTDPGTDDLSCHPELINYFTQETYHKSSVWHGTATTAFVAANHDLAQNLGFKGVAHNVSIVPVRTMGRCSSGTWSDIADSIVWAAGGNIDGEPTNPNPAHIISISIGSKDPSDTAFCSDYLQSSIDEAMRLGSIIVASAGNIMVNVSKVRLAVCKGPLIVGSTDSDGERSFYSNYGQILMTPLDKIDGHEFLGASILIANDYDNILHLVPYHYGTSYAAPQVSGLLALALSLTENPRALGLNATLISAIKKYVGPFGANSTCQMQYPYYCGTGIVNAAYFLGNLTSLSCAAPATSRTISSASPALLAPPQNQILTGSTP